ncbi:MAG: 2-oxo acid dehydrogenase subunit E2, partial [Anaerolineaceae bacterium]|nr:2-oxo acid dehydrogenase subunit E2 [Anaerolineaceae bacterium]
EKATVELEAPAAGVLKGIRKGAENGAEVPVGEPLAFIAAPDEQVPALPPLNQLADSAPAVGQLIEPSAGSNGKDAGEEEGAIRATPIARKLAKDLQIDLEQVKGSGPRGRIREGDVRAYALAQAAQPGQESNRQASGIEQLPQPVVPGPARESTAAPAAEWLDLTSIQRLTGERMLESVRSAPQFALEISVDATSLLRFRSGLAGGQEKLSITAFLVKAAAAILKKHPRANAVYQDGKIQLLGQVNIGVAVGSDSGLYVPVIRSADQKQVTSIQQELLAFQEKAAADPGSQKKHFHPVDFEGGTFTISNLGMYGVERFTAILNSPQSAILAVGKIVMTPVGIVDEESQDNPGASQELRVMLRPMIHLTLTIDHRVMDGLHGAKFLSDLKSSLERLSFLV